MCILAFIVLFQEINSFLLKGWKWKKYLTKWKRNGTIGTPPSLSEEASWSTLQMQDNAFSNEEYDVDDEIDHNK